MRYKQLGLTLTEIMIALTIGLLLLTGIVHIYVGSKKSYAVNENLSRLQEEGFYALELISREIRMAGFQPVASPRNVPAALMNAIAGGNNTGPNQSDLLGVSYTSAVDCVNRSVPGGTTLNTYFLAPGANGRPALFCNATELVANVDNLQFAYGVDSNGDLSPEHYLPADQVANMANVVSVRVALLISSEQPVNDRAGGKVFNLAGETIGPLSDKYIRRVYSSTVRIRNCLRNAC